MHHPFQRFFLTLVIYFSVCIYSYVFITPYSFVCSWSASTLISIFFTPLFLLFQDQLSISKRVFIIVSSLFAIICIGFLFNISQNVQQHQRQDTFNQVQNKVLQNIQQEIASTIEQVNSLSALFKSTEQVSRREFELFAQHVFQNNSSVRALTWAPIITHENRAEFTKFFGSVNEKNI